MTIFVLQAMTVLKFIYFKIGWGILLMNIDLKGQQVIYGSCCNQFGVTYFINSEGCKQACLSNVNRSRVA